MSDDFFKQGVRLIMEDDDTYPPEAYEFIRQSVSYAQRKKSQHEESNQVSTAELVLEIKNYALKEYGPMAFYLLKKWSIDSTDDFGNIIYNLIEYKIFGEGDHDQRQDFNNAYNFHDVFMKPYKAKLAKFDIPQIDV